MTRAPMIPEDRSMCLGIPGKVIEIHDEGGLPMGVVDFGGVRRSVCLAYVRHEVGLGDYVIVHVGFAISKVDEVEAQRTFEVLREMSKHDELDWMAELGAMPSTAPTTASE